MFIVRGVILGVMGGRFLFSTYGRRHNRCVGNHGDTNGTSGAGLHLQMRKNIISLALYIRRLEYASTIVRVKCEDTG